MRVLEMALVGRYNSLQVVKHTNFGLYLDGGADGEILLPNRYIPKDIPSEDEDWLNVFVYLDSDDKLIATTEKPKVQVGEFASLKVVEVNSIGIFLDWGLSKTCCCRIPKKNARCRPVNTSWCMSTWTNT